MKPENGDYYNWDTFVLWCEENGVSIEHEDDYLAWWKCWKTAYICAVNR